MLTYLATSACRGKRPPQFAAHRAYSRPALVSRLLRERNVARFLVAPPGFGKSSVVLEYAETVFGFNQVYWLDCTSPCFLRDLDGESIASGLLDATEPAFLAVFEDVPLLDGARVDAFCALLDTLLDRGCEVIVTCTPLCDAFAAERDRMVLFANDLLLSNDEIDFLRTPAERDETPANRMPRARRVPACAWGDGQNAAFLCGVLTEELPCQMLAALFVLLCLDSGPLSSVERIAHADAEALSFIAAAHVYVGVDVAQRSFRCAGFPVGDVAEAFAGRLEDIASGAGGVGAAQLAADVASTLLASGNAERACEVARLFLPAAERAIWLEEHARDLERVGCLMRARGLYAATPPEVFSASAHVAQAVRCALLGENVAACVAARRAIACAPSVVERAIVQAVQCACSVGEASEQAAARARDVCAVGIEAECGDELRDIAMAVEALDAPSSGVELARAWLDATTDRALSDSALYAAALLLGRLDEADAGAQEWADVAAMVAREATARFGDAGSLSLPCALAAAAFQQLVDNGVLAMPPLDAACAVAAAARKRMLLEQRIQCEAARTAALERRLVRDKTHPDTFRCASVGSDMALRTPPRLTVNLFGGLEVFMGDRRIDPNLLMREKVRALLALLVVNQGHDLSRDRIMKLLWPDSHMERARNNFYATWSRLRTALSMPDGTCPYLIKRQYGIRLDASLLSSDVAELDRVCRALLFNRPGRGGWGHLFSQIEDSFSSDLLPGDEGCELLDDLRSDCRTRLVDALVTASGKLVEAGEVRQGLWFARAALSRDKSREDAYAAVMRAQIASLQRSAALETYFSCRKFLSNDLGIDPSAETIRLYHSIIDAQEEVA